jgi:hypothetical protein
MLGNGDAPEKSKGRIMGYTTEFIGSIKVEPPLSKREVDYLNAFSGSRRMDRKKGPFYVDDGHVGFMPAEDVIDHNQPPTGQPGLWCQWVPSEDGSEIAWDGGEKFYCPDQWMAYIRSYFVVLGAARLAEPHALDFQTRHEMSGLIHAVGENGAEDVWRMKVDKDGVWVAKGEWADHVKREKFGFDPATGKETGMEWDELADSGEAIEWVVDPSRVSYEAWQKVPDFANPRDEAMWRASMEKTELDKAAGAGSAGPASKAL